jgi:succinate dehydrogenase/fumarate reductase flavoprotein subunit
MHVVVPSSPSFAFHLTRHCRRLGVDIRLGERATRLLQHDGRVVGVEASRADGSAHELRARRGVVLAAGDYSNGRELKARYASPDVADVEAVNVTATGDGQRLALELGATVVNGDIVRGPIMRFVPPGRRSWLQRVPPTTSLARLIAWSYEHLPARVVRPFLLRYLTTALGPSSDLFAQGAVLVNREGRRFTDECAKPNPDVARQPGRDAWIVLDATIAARFSAWPHFVSTAPGVAYAYLADYRRNRPDLFHTAPTIAGLARSVGVPAEALERTIAEYNEGGRGERPALAAPPFYALGPARSYVVFTDGGLAVTERLEVVGSDGRPIPGLYAAGSNGQGGLLLEGHGHHLCWAFASGRIAGRNAATAEAVEPRTAYSDLSTGG